MKYIDAEKLKEKIQPLYENAKQRAHFAGETGTSSDCAKYNESKFTYEHILWLINALQQEQPEVDLEEEMKSWRHNHFYGKRDKEAVGEYLERVSQLDLAKHFFELGLKSKQC